MLELHLDYETASRVDLKKVGADVYSRHPSTKVLMASWAWGDDGEIKTWLPHEGTMPEELRKALSDKSVRKIAFNAAFEIAITRNTLKIETDASQWRCVMVLGLSLGLPGKMELLVRDALKLDKKFWKDPEGDALMRRFSYPSSKSTHETHPVEFARYVGYNRQDVVAETKAYKIMRKYVVDIDGLFEFWVLDQRINNRGVPVDYDFIEQAKLLAARAKEIAVAKLIEMTGLKNPNSGAQLLPWLNERGYPFSGLARNRVEIALRDNPEMEQLARDVLQLRIDSNKTSLAKFDAIERASFRGRLRNIFQLMGAAATGRWAGRILGQNMPRPWKGVEEFLGEARRLIADGNYEDIEFFFGKVLDVITSSIRSAIAAPFGKKFVVADLASIELVVGAWLCNSVFWLDVVRSGKDAYKAFGSRWLGVPYDEVTKEQRGWSKPPTLGCQFRLSAGRQVGVFPDVTKTGLWGYAANMGIEMTKQQCKEAVKIYRELSPEIVNAWYELDRAAMDCVLEGEPKKAGKLMFDMKPPFLRMRLPSGRYLHYCRPRIEQVTVEFEDEETGEIITSKKIGLTYERVHQQTGKWVRTTTHGGKLIENCLGRETKILTPYGPKRIVDLAADESVWDGECWVTHGGVVDQGLQLTIGFGGGIRVTPNHRVDVGMQWVEAGDTSYAEAASSFGRHYRAPQSYVDGDSLRRIERRQVTVGSEVRLRHGQEDGGVGVSEEQDQVLRVREIAVDKCGEHDARHVEAPGVRSLAVDEGSLHTSDASSVGELRWSGYFRLRALARIVRGFLGRHGADLRSRVGHRASEQQRQLQQAELSLGDTSGQLPEPPSKQDNRHAERSDASLRSGRGLRDRNDDACVPVGERLAREENVRQAGRYEQVFDVLNAGPNRRFTIVGDDGRLVLVHNCIQAIARDLLAEGIQNAEDAGLNPIFHFHDEIGCEVDEDDEDALRTLIECMTRVPKWAGDMPVRAEGYEDSFYHK